MVRGFRLAAALAAAALFGTGFAQEQPGGHEPGHEPEPAPQQAAKACKCTITAKFGNVSVTANGTVKIQVQVTGNVTSAPKSEEKFQPKLTLNGYILYKTKDGAWERSGGLGRTTLDLFNEARACGAGDAFDKTFSTDAIQLPKAPDAPAAVLCEYHMWLTSDTCEMKPVRGYAKFVFTRGKGGKDKDGKPKPQSPRATVMEYDMKKDKDGKIVAYLSANSDNGWQAAAAPPMWYP